MNMSLLERLYFWIHRRVFQKRLEKRVRFQDKYVVSVGNLSAGGTGKTPAVALLARGAFERNLPVLAVLRGYGGQASKTGVLVSNGEDILADQRQAGDEAMLLADIQGLSVAAGRNRPDLIRRFGADHKLILLDDAFQNPLVYRDHELVLLDACVPLSRLRLIPRGKFREPLAALERAHTVLFTRVDQADQEEFATLKAAVTNMVDPANIFESAHRSRGVFRATGAKPLSARAPATSTEDAACGAFCGIGNPESFYKTLSEAGIELLRRRSFADHHDFTSRELSELEEFLREDESRRWITTEKDFMRLRAPGAPGKFRVSQNFLSRLDILKIRLEILGGREKEFLERVLGKIF